jgi:Inorganic Pyrophosphatase
VPPLKQDLSRHLNHLAAQVSKSAWRRISETRKLAKSEQANSTQAILDAIKEEFKISVIDKTGSELSQPIINTLYRTLRGLADAGDIVRRAIESYTLMEILLYSGTEIHEGCYAGAMADYEVDEARLYIAADRVFDGEQPLTLGEHNVGKDFRTVLAHEIGHVLMPFVEKVIGQKFAILYDTQTKDYWSQRVSTYGATDDHELFGEAFAAWTRPQYTKAKVGLPNSLSEIFTLADIEPSGKVSKLAKATRQDIVSIIANDGTVVSAKKIKEILAAVEDADWFIIEGDISPALLNAFEDAGYSELANTASSGDKALFSTVSSDAKQYAEEHAAELVSGLEDLLRGTITDAIEEGWGKDELATEIESNYAFGEVRSETIARNELARAYSRGRISAAEGAGAIKKRSLLSADHDDAEDCDCSAAAEAGAVDFDESFTDDPDYDFAPYHVHCECDWVGIYPGDEDDEDEDDSGDEEDEGIDEEHGTNKFVKGGPGSGPHPGSRRENRDKASTHANNARIASRKIKDSAAKDAKELSDYASDATQLTNMIDSRSLHMTAAKEHTLAAEAHDKLGNTKIAADHRAAAELHTHLAETKQNKFAKTRQPQPDDASENYVAEQLSDEEIAADNNAMELSGIALALAPEDDADGMYASGFADTGTRAAIGCYRDAATRQSYHQQAHDLHVNACLHYKERGKKDSEEAHQNVANQHTAIIRMLDALEPVAKRSIDKDAYTAATSASNDTPEPSEKQKHAGNYQKGHLSINGINIAIENPMGTRRRPGWETLKAHYGYIKLTEGADGDHVDVFVRNGTPDDYAGPVYVIDQYINGKFDEHKIMIGWQSKQKAVEAYLGSYQDGWQCGPVTRLSWRDFKSWIDKRSLVEPVSKVTMV